MKKCFAFIFLSMLLASSSFAQLQKGNKMLGGTVSYSSSTRTSESIGVTGGQTNKSNGFYASPFLGYFVSDRTVVGLGLDFSGSNYENTSQSGSISTTDFNQFGFGPFVRRYFPVKEWVAFYGQAALGYAMSTSKQNYSGTEYEYNTKSIGLSTSLGLAFFPTQWMSLDLAINPLSYTHQITRNEEGTAATESDVDSFNFNLSTESFSIGAHFFFNKK